MTVKAILFDKDGTLIDFGATWNQGTFEVFQHLSNNDAELIRKLAAVSDFDLKTNSIRPNSILVASSPTEIGELWAEVLSQKSTPEFLAKIDALYGLAGTKYLTGLPSTHKVLDRLRNNDYLLGIATNDSEANAIEQMALLGWSDFFNIIYGYDSGSGQKPSPGMVNAFCNHLGLKPVEVVMIGDSLHDLNAGNAAGVLTIGVTTGMATSAELQAHAHAIIDDLDELFHVLQQPPFC